MDLTEAEDGKNKNKNSEQVARIHKELYKKELQDQDNHDGMITDLEPDILECKVKWA